MHFLVLCYNGWLLKNCVSFCFLSSFLVVELVECCVYFGNQNSVEATDSTKLEQHFLLLLVSTRDI